MKKTWIHCDLLGAYCADECPLIVAARCPLDLLNCGGVCGANGSIGLMTVSIYSLLERLKRS